MVYLHVPFCKSFCTYCDFYSEICASKESAGVQKLFAERVCREVEERRDEIAAARFPRTLYVGGGTPSVLDIRILHTIVSHIAAAQRLARGSESESSTLRGMLSSPHCQPPATAQQLRREVREATDLPFEEFTVEVNPEDIVRKGAAYARALVGLGVTRVSMGVQSFDDQILRWMNRRHNAATAVKAVSILRDAGVKNMSIDLIFGISHLSDDVWMETIEKALELRPEHISAYQLSIEPGSALAGMVADGRYREAGEEQCRLQYELLCSRLTAAGFRHYEISNFAKPGFEALHHSAYWVRLPYVGLGPGAHSFDGVRTRSWNSEGLTDWSRSSEVLTDEDVHTETLMLGLRTADGLPEDWLRDNCDPAILDSLLDEGSLARTASPHGHIRIPEIHFFTSDSIISELL